MSFLLFNSVNSNAEPLGLPSLDEPKPEDKPEIVNNISADVLKDAVGDVFHENANKPEEAKPLAVAKEVENNLPIENPPAEEQPIINEPSYSEISAPKPKNNYSADLQILSKPEYTAPVIAQTSNNNGNTEEITISVSASPEDENENKNSENTAPEIKNEEPVKEVEIKTSQEKPAKEIEEVKEVIAEPIKPINEEEAVQEIKIVEIDDGANSPENIAKPEMPIFNALPKSMQKTANLVVADKVYKTNLMNPINNSQVVKLPPRDDIEALNELIKLSNETRPVITSKNIRIKKGDFNDPFYDEVEPYKEKNQENQKMVYGNRIANIPPAEDTLQIKPEEKKPKKPPQIFSKPEFYDQEKTLAVEVKKQTNEEIISFRKDAFDALSMGMYEVAVTYYKKIIEIQPRDKNALFGLATAYHKAKQYSNAKEIYRKIISEDVNNNDAINNYVILLSEEYGDEAIPKLEKLWQDNKEIAGIAAHIANLHYKKNNLKKAIEYYFQAVAVEPENIDYKYNLAVLLEKYGASDLAVKYYQNLLDEAAKGKILPEDPLTIRERYFSLLSIKN